MTAITKEFIPDVPFGKVHPNPWNPNQMSDEAYQGVRESIKEYGFIDPLTVWPWTDIPAEFGIPEGEWMHLDGEHRWRAAQDESIEKVDLMVLHGLELPQAKKLTIILNETRGDPDVSLLGVLLADLHEAFDGDMAKLKSALPYSDAEMKHFLDIGSIDWDKFNEEMQTGEQRQARHAQTEHTVFLKFDQAQRERWDAFLDIMAREGGDSFTIEAGVLDAMAAKCKSL